MLKTIQSNHKNLVDLKKNFQASIGSLMNKSFTKHKEYFDLLERCHEHLNNIKQLSDKSLKEFEQFKQTYSAVSGAGKKSRDKDCFFDASRFSHSIRAIVRTLKQFCDDLIALKPLAVSKDNEALKILIKAFREFTSFTQKNFGPTLTSNLLKAKFVFDQVRAVDQINDDYSVESEYCIGDVLTDEELETIAATRDMLNKEIKVGLALNLSSSESTCSTASGSLFRRTISCCTLSPQRSALAPSGQACLRANWS